LTIEGNVCYITYEPLAGEESSLAPLPFPNLGASTASAFLLKKPGLKNLFLSNSSFII
jgi:hypothetical protein